MFNPQLHSKQRWRQQLFLARWCVSGRVRDVGGREVNQTGIGRVAEIVTGPQAILALVCETMCCIWQGLHPLATYTAGLSCAPEEGWTMEAVWGSWPPHFISASSTEVHFLQPHKYYEGSRLKRGDERKRINEEDQNGEDVARCQFITFIS